MVVLAADEATHFEGRFWRFKQRAVIRAANRAARNGRHLGLKRPEFLHQPGLAQRVVHAFPGASAVAVLREPGDRAISAYFHWVDHGLLRAERDFEAHLTRLFTKGPKTSAERMIVDYSRYHRAAEQLQESFGERTMFVFQDELLDDPSGWLGSIMTHIGVERGHTLTLDERNVGRYPRSRNAAAVIFGALSYRYEGTPAVVTVRPRFARALGAPFGQFRPAARRSFGRPEVSDTLRAAMREYYSSDLESLEALLGRAVPSAWLRG